MSHTITETNSIKINDHNKTRSVIHHRLHQSRQTIPYPIKHFTAILTTEHQSHDLPTCHNTPRIHRACANFPYNVNKSSDVDSTSAHPHRAQQLNTPSTQYTATQEHTAHTSPTQNTTLYHLLCDCAELYTHIKTNQTIINIVSYYHDHYIIVNLIYTLTHLINRKICFHSFNTRNNAEPEKFNYTGNLFYKKVHNTTTKAGIRTHNGK